MSGDRVHLPDLGGNDQRDNDLRGNLGLKDSLGMGAMSMYKHQISKSKRQISPSTLIESSVIIAALSYPSILRPSDCHL